MITQHIDFNTISAIKFEELCFEILFRLGFTNIQWRKGGSDSGRDLEALQEKDLFGVQKYTEKWTFECKRYRKGVPPEELNSKIAWADAQRPDHLVFFISSYLTNNAREWLKGIASTKPYKIHIVEGEELKQLVGKFEDIAFRFFNEDFILELVKYAEKKWVIHGLFPDCETIMAVVNNKEYTRLSTKDVSFLTTTFYLRFDFLKVQLDDYYGVDVSECLLPIDVQLSHVNVEGHDPIICLEDKIEVLGENGDLNEYDEITEYGFIAAEIALYNKTSIGIYLLKRISDETAIEMLIEKTSDLTTKVRLVKNYDSSYFEKIMQVLGYKPQHRITLLETSPLMTNNTVQNL